MVNQAKYYLKKLIRQGFTFNKILKELQQSQYFSKEQLENLQNQKLRKIIHHCYKNVPYYTDLFNSLNLKPEDISIKEDLAKLPFLDKHIVRENFDKLIAKNTLEFLCKTAKTTGTTGTPGKFLRDYYSINFEKAMISRFEKCCGDKNLRRLTLRADVVVPFEQDVPPFWEYNKADDELIMSAYHLCDKNAKYFIDKILEFNPEIMYLQPSTACILARIFQDIPNKLDIKAIFTSSETLSGYQKDFVEKTFKTKIYDRYGMVERVAAIGHCEKGNYHIFEDYSIVELIPQEDYYEICGTDFNNFAMPLLRYKTGDLVILEENKCTCGRNFREVSSIQGRAVNYILTPEHTKKVNLDLINRDIENIVETQYVQESIDELIVKIVATPNFTEKDEQKIINNTRDYISPNMKISIEKVDEIPRNKNGKFVNVIRKFETNEKSFFEANYEK